ncbi:MAG: hypothetical protein ABIP39_00165, partial [Polyangiaceae bacterium]
PAIIAEPKRHDDEHSRGAAWRTKSELASLPLRHEEVVTWIDRFESASPLLPCAAYHPYGMAVGRPWSALMSR